MTDPDLRTTAAAMVRPGAGILAADESTATCSGRLRALGIHPTEEARRAYREVLLGADGLANHVSGVILYDETIRQRSSAGVPFPELLTGQGILPGIKLDTGAKPLAGTAGETITEGLDGLRERIVEYRSLGARFAKWRAVLTVAPNMPTTGAIIANAHALARYAALCQEGGLVPIVEPEVLMDGDHTLERCTAITLDVLTEVFAQLRIAGVDLAGVVLKPSMVLPGRDGAPVAAATVAAATVDCLRAAVPASVAGIAFLSGGQAPDIATEHLAAMAALGPHPWPLTFSFGRAIQDDVLRAWSGDVENVPRAREILQARVRANADASLGRAPAAA
jgi:fructose-bisphosphate aldolase class I